MAKAGTITFTGAFTQDDQVQLFHYSVQNLAPVTVYTTSYAAGGFTPYLALFDSTGNFLTEGFLNYNGSDASISWMSNAAGTYTIALTQYDNVSYGPTYTLADGFTRSGQGNFTEIDTGMYNGPFETFFGQRTGDWGVSFSSPDPTLAAGVPEPGTFALLAGGGALLLAVRLRRRTRKTLF